jgi:hypothetical protein
VINLELSQKISQLSIPVDEGRLKTAARRGWSYYLQTELTSVILQDSRDLAQPIQVKLHRGCDPVGWRCIR